MHSFTEVSGTRSWSYSIVQVFIGFLLPWEPFRYLSMMQVHKGMSKCDASCFPRKVPFPQACSCCLQNPYSSAAGVCLALCTVPEIQENAVFSDVFGNSRLTLFSFLWGGFVLLKSLFTLGALLCQQLPPSLLLNNFVGKEPPGFMLFSCNKEPLQLLQAS